MNCLGFLEKTKVVPTKDNTVETADYRFLLKPFLVHRHNNGGKRKQLNTREKRKGFKRKTLVFFFFVGHGKTLVFQQGKYCLKKTG